MTTKSTLLAIVLLFGFNWNLLRGCECQEVGRAPAFSGATVVFQGRVAAIEHLKMVEVIDPNTGTRQLHPPEIDDHMIVTFEVTRAWKGEVNSTTKVHSVARPKLCDGYRFEVGREYVVYASDNLNQEWAEIAHRAHGMHVYEIDDCPLRIRTDVSEETKLLGKGFAPIVRPSIQ